MDPDKLKELAPHKFHRKESLFPHTYPHHSLRQLVLNVPPGDYTVLPSKGRGRKGTAIRVWRRHVNVVGRLWRRRRIHALWELAVRDVLGPDASSYTFYRVEHEAYIIYYCVRATLPIANRWKHFTIATHDAELSDKDRLFLFRVENGYYYTRYDFT